MSGVESLERESQGERASLTGQKEDVDGSNKRKTPPKPTGTRFKAVGNMVLAMRRFQASLNPTVTFGKPSSSAGGSVSSSGTGQGVEATSAPPRGPLDPANKGKLRRMNTPGSRNRIATILQPLPKEVDV